MLLFNLSVLTENECRLKERKLGKGAGERWGVYVCVCVGWRGWGCKDLGGAEGGQRQINTLKQEAKVSNI